MGASAPTIILKFQFLCGNIKNLSVYVVKCSLCTHAFICLLYFYYQRYTHELNGLASPLPRCIVHPHQQLHISVEGWLKNPLGHPRGWKPKKKKKGKTLIKDHLSFSNDQKKKKNKIKQETFFLSLFVPPIMFSSTSICGGMVKEASSSPSIKLNDTWGHSNIPTASS